MSTAPTRKRFKITARVTPWSNADGTENNVVRLFGGTRSLAIDMSEIPALIDQLESIHAEHTNIAQYTDHLFIEET